MLRRALIVAGLSLALVFNASAQPAKPNPQVKLQTAQGEIVLESENQGVSALSPNGIVASR